MNERPWLPTLLSGLSLTIAIAALVVSLVAATHGRADLSRYDFSTPKATLESSAKMVVNGDVATWMAYQLAIERTLQKEKLATVKFHKEAEFQGNKLLFVSFERRGVPAYEIDAFEKDAASGWWHRSYVTSYTVATENPSLGALMDRWEKTGKLD